MTNIHQFNAAQGAFDFFPYTDLSSPKSVAIPGAQVINTDYRVNFDTSRETPTSPEVKPYSLSLIPLLSS